MGCIEIWTDKPLTQILPQELVALRWEYLCKWLVGPHSYKLQPQSHHHATYLGERAITMQLIEVEVHVKVAF